MLSMWPDLPGFSIEAIDLVDREYVVIARATRSTVNCPECDQLSAAVHSWYERAPRDLPSSGNMVRLLLHARRFFCKNENCHRKIFCEPAPLLVQKYARSTQRLAEALTTLAFALGGKEGERIVVKLGMPASRDTLLRLIRKQDDVQLPEPRVIGVDDWAYRKGQTYGTLVCDLEQGVVIDLLPDREANTLAEWLKDHPTIEVITRDRAESYAAGAAEGAPDAIEIADRWHLAKNLVDAVEASLAQHPGCLWGEQTQTQSVSRSCKIIAEAPQQQTSKADALAAREAKRALRQAQYERIIALKQQNVRLEDIAAQVGLGIRTVNRWLAHGTFPERKQRATQPTKLDPYRKYITQRWQEGCRNAAQLHREVKQQGYAGSYASVYEHCRELLHRANEDENFASTCTVLPQPRRRYSPRQAAFLFIQQPNKLSDTKKADLEAILAQHPQFPRWCELAQQFMVLLRERNPAALDTRLATVAESGSSPLKRFAAGLQEDYAEVSAALTYQWSNDLVAYYTSFAV